MRTAALFLALVAFAGCGTGKSDGPSKQPPPVVTATNEFSTYLGNDLADAVRDLVTAFHSGSVPHAMTDDRYYNLRTMQRVRLLR